MAQSYFPTVVTHMMKKEMKIKGEIRINKKSLLTYFLSQIHLAEHKLIKNSQALLIRDYSNLMEKLMFRKYHFGFIC